MRAALKLVAQVIAPLVPLAAMVLTLVCAFQLATAPFLHPFVERGTDELVSTLDREIARIATQPFLAARLEALLAQEPRNWLAIEAVEDVATERGLALPDALSTRRDALWQSDTSATARTKGCLACAWDAANCSLTQAMVCQLPIALTPLPDITTLVRSGVVAASGGEVDRVDVALSAVGLGASVLVLASGGSSLSLKAGTSVLKLARRMALMPPPLMALIARTARHGIDWQKAGEIATLTAPSRLLRPEVVRPLAEISSDLGRIESRIGPAATLHLIRYVDGPREARVLARASEGMGAKIVGRVEVLGKERFLRAALRWSDEAWWLFTGFCATLVALVSTLSQIVLWRIGRSVRAASRSAN